jgi:type 1 glutamine amidotransferase
MRIIRFAAIFALSLTLCGSCAAQPKKKKLLAIGEVKGFQHDSVSHALATIWKIGQESGVYDTYIRTDTELITKKKLSRNAKNLSFFDAVLFYTSGELDMDPQQKADLLSFIRDDGKGFLGAHSANDTFYKWSEYGELLGAYFDLHPWGQFQAPIIVEDPSFPVMKPFPRAFTVMDEIYQMKNFSRDRVRVLMRLDADKIDLKQKGVHRTDKDFAVTWVRNYGKGRVFYSALGHREDVWDRPDVQKMWLEAIKWAMGLIPGDATPRPMPAE